MAMPDIYTFDELKIPIQTYLPMKQQNDTITSEPKTSDEIITPTILSELRNDRREYIKDVFEAIKLAEYYGYIKTQKEEVIVVDDKDKPKAVDIVRAIGIGAAILMALATIL